MCATIKDFKRAADRWKPAPHRRTGAIDSFRVSGTPESGPMGSHSRLAGAQG